MRTFFPILIIGCLALLYEAEAADPWTELESGLDVGRFNTLEIAPAVDGDLIVLRVDPALWDLRVMSSKLEEEDRGRDPWDWCRKYDLVAAINAGMYQEDHRTHVGYTKVNGRVTNRASNDYLSAAAFDPIDPADPPFRIFDLDEIQLGEVAARYRTVIQNLRLVKRAGLNRWQRSRESWREAALGEDFKGRCLLMYCHRKLSMHDFNEILLALPLGLVTAQHLEGSAPAKLWIEHTEFDAKSMPGGLRSTVLLPNILGVAKRHPQENQP